MISAMKGNNSSSMTGVMNQMDFVAPRGQQENMPPPVRVDAQGAKQYGFNPDEGHMPPSPQKVISMQQPSRQQNLAPSAADI